MQNNDFDRGIRDLLNSNEPAYNPADWDRMEDLLHQAGATSQPGQGAEGAASGSAAQSILAGGKVWLAAAMVALTGVNVAVLVTSQNPSKTTVSLVSAENAAAETTESHTAAQPDQTPGPAAALTERAATQASNNEGKSTISAGLQQQITQAGATRLPASTSAPATKANNSSEGKNTAGNKNSGAGNSSASGFGSQSKTGNSGNGGNYSGGFFSGMPAKAGLVPVLPCAGNRQPYLPYLVSGTDTVTTFQFDLKTCEPFCLNLPGSDADGDRITFSADLDQLPGSFLETNPGNPAQASFCWTPKAAHARQEPYTLKVNLQNESCPGFTTYTVVLNVHPSAALHIAGDTMLAEGQQTRLRAVTPAREVSFTWLPATGLRGSRTGAEVLAAPTAGTTYTLQMTTANGCQLQAMHRVEVAAQNTEQTVFVPNIFTPNGDGVNDFFEVKGMEPGEMDLTVYSRSGKTVFHSPGYANRWNGGNLPEGVYTYVLRNTRTGKVFTGMVEINR